MAQEASRKAAIRTWADPIIRERRTKALKVANSKPRTKEHRRKLGLAHRGVKASEKTREQMAASHRDRFLKIDESHQCKMCGSTKHTYAQHQRRVVAARKKSKKWKESVLAANTRREYSVARFGQFYDGLDEQIWMRSGWEVKFADWLDRNGIEWQYEPKHFPVGKGPWSGMNYTPDFYLPNWDLYIELKGWLRKADEKRLQVFISRYPKVASGSWVMLRYEGLRALGVL